MKRKKSKLKIQSKGKAYCLTDSPLYKLSTKKRLSKILNQSTLELTALCCDAGNYSEFEDVGKNGKPRKIQKPLVKLDVIHTRIASLLSRIKVPDYLHSGKKKHSNVTNARAHKGTSKVLATDIKSFFPSTTKKMVFSFFYSVMKCSPDVANILANLCTYHSHIPTGSRISMPLAFWANIRMFNELENLSIKHDVSMTVYVDDLTFSGDNTNKLFRSCVNRIISKHGHTMHPTKTKLYKAEQPKLITGVVVKGNELKVRNEQHYLLSSEMDLWKAIKNEANASQTPLMSKLVGRLYSMGVIDERFKAKAISVKSSTCP
ncbi:MAG: reverse transcriptase family protein [Vibrio litoralis]